MFIQSSGFVYFTVSFGNISLVINVATRARKDVHPAIETPTLVPAPVKDEEIPTLTPPIPTKICEIV